MGSWLSAIVSCTLHHSQGQSKTQGGRSTWRTQGPTREQRPVSLSPAWHEISQARAPRRQHTRRPVHGDVPPVIPVHLHLLVVHSMSGFLSKTSYERCRCSMGCETAMAREHSLSLTTVTGEGNRTFRVAPTAARPLPRWEAAGGMCVCASLTPARWC
jgi:hypothetical protein